MTVYKRGDRYRARVQCNGVTYNVGTFDSREEAHAVSEEQAARLRDGTSILLNPKALTTLEYAEQLGVPKGTVKRWIHEGMPAVKMGDVVRILPSDADAWVCEFHSDSVSFGRKSVVYIAVRDRDGAFKIGWTSDIERRLRELRKDEKDNVSLVAVFRGDKPDELALHAKFAEYRIEREWFKAEGRLLDYVASIGRVAA